MRIAKIALLFLLLFTAAANAEQLVESSPRIASDGNGFFAVWRQESPNTLVGSAVTTGHPILQSPPVKIADRPYDFALGASDSGYLVVWSDNGALRAVRASTTGMILDPQPITLGTVNAVSPSITWTGKSFFVVWTEVFHGGGGGIVGAFVSPNGQLSTPKTILTDNGFSGGLAHVAWNGSRFLLTFSGSRICDPLCYSGAWQIYLARLDAGGALIDPPQSIRPTHSDAATHAMATDGHDFLVAYDRIDGGIAYFRVSIDGPSIVTGPDVPLFSWFSISSSDLIWDGHNYVLASIYENAIPFRAAVEPYKAWLSLTRLAGNGTVVSRDVMSLATSSREPHVASNGTDIVIIDVEDARVRTHTPAEMHRSAAPPSAPSIVGVTNSGRATTITWTANNREPLEGFIISSITPFQGVPGVSRGAVRVVGADKRSTSFVPQLTGNVSFDVSAFNEGGMSSPSVPAQATNARRRTAGH